jgi:hypothetical protein
MDSPPGLSAAGGQRGRRGVSSRVFGLRIRLPRRPGTGPHHDRAVAVGMAGVLLGGSKPGPGQSRGAYSIERNGQSRSSQARTAW